MTTATRKEFVRMVSAAAIGAAAAPLAAQGDEQGRISAMLVKGRDIFGFKPPPGKNLVLVDLRDSMKFPSHPEIATANSADTAKVRERVAALKAMGLEVVPLLEFSTVNDDWLGEYERMVCSSVYRRILPELIGDAFEAFGRPKYVHMGYANEGEGFHPKDAEYVLSRTGVLWMRWVKITGDCVKALGARPWAWYDCGWRMDDFYEHAPKDYVYSNLRPLSAIQRDKRTFRESMSRLSQAGYSLVPRLAKGETFGGKGVMGELS